jgi:nucleoside phosphorylase
VVPNDELAQIVALSIAIRGADGEGAREALAENLLSLVERISPSTASICGSVLSGLGTPEGAEIGAAILKRVGSVADNFAFASSLEPVDVMILAIKPPELDACLAVFGVPAHELPTPLGATGLCGWFVRSDNARVLITMTGAAGNVNTAMVMSSVFKLVKPRLAMLVGMAAGLEDKVRCGDVVVAEEVLAYEFARMTEDGPMYQQRAQVVKRELIASAELLPRLAGTWADQCRDLVREAIRPRDEGLPSEREIKEWYPQVHRGVVLAGARLLEDGSLPKLREDLHDRVRAAEMEGAGFAAACEEGDRVPWMVIRGIADYGNPERTKGWQYASSVAAAMFAREALRSDLLLAT